MLNLDTHIVILSLKGELLPREKKLLSINPKWGISAIVLWEISKLAQLKRINFDLEHPVFEDFLRNIQVLPVDHHVCKYLNGLDFVSDPADAIIAATSLAYQIPLLTRDRRILKSKKVPLIS